MNIIINGSYFWDINTRQNVIGHNTLFYLFLTVVVFRGGESMQRKTTLISQKELFMDIPVWRDLQNYEGSFETYWKLLDCFGKGFMYLIKFRPGLMLGIGNYSLRENINIISEAYISAFAIDFTFSGSMTCTFNYRSGNQAVHVFEQNQGSISYRPEYQCVSTLRGKIPLRVMGIYVDPILLKNIIREQYYYIPADMHDIIDGNASKFYYHPLTRTMEANRIVHEIFNCPYHGELKRLWLEGKTLELITHTLAQLDINKVKGSRVFGLQSCDSECVFNAKNILICNLGNPPSLIELANMVGTNKDKLTRGFREIFGTSVFEYLRNHRLEYGRELLKSGKKNVTEVAIEVGYAQQSNFTKAFKKYFGTNPTSYLP